MMSLISRLFGKRTEMHDGHSLPCSGQERQSSDEPERAIRIAVYDSLGTIPRIMDIRSGDYSELLNEVSSKTYTFAHEKGGNVPYIAIKEIVENLLHADLQEAVITILPDGNTIRVSDQGPGITDKERAFLPGFTTASSKMKETVRGVGSGLPIVKDSMRSVGGSILIEDNLKKGCVITLSCEMEGVRPHVAAKEQLSAVNAASSRHSTVQRTPDTIEKSQRDEKRENATEKESGAAVPVEKLSGILSSRQQKVFMILAEEGEGGPSLVAKELEISLSTAYRDLVALEEHGLIHTIDSSGKRRLTSRGIAFLPYITG